jgi:hypothetical protein
MTYIPLFESFEDLNLLSVWRSPKPNRVADLQVNGYDYYFKIFDLSGSSRYSIDVYKEYSQVGILKASLKDINGKTFIHIIGVEVDPEHRRRAVMANIYDLLLKSKPSSVMGIHSAEHLRNPMLTPFYHRMGAIWYAGGFIITDNNHKFLVDNLLPSGYGSDGKVYISGDYAYRAAYDYGKEKVVIKKYLDKHKNKTQPSFIVHIVGMKVWGEHLVVAMEKLTKADLGDDFNAYAKVVGGLSSRLNDIPDDLSPYSKAAAEAFRDTAKYFGMPIIDMSSSNIMVDKNGDLKVIDWF